MTPLPRLHRPWLPLTAELIERLRATDQPAHRIVATFLREHRQIGRRDQGFIVETAWAELRAWRFVDAVLARAASAGHAPHAWDRALVACTHGLGWPAAAWPVDDAHRDRLVDALRAVDPSLPESDLDALAVRHGVPDAFVRALAARHGDDAARTILTALRERAPTVLRVAGSPGNRTRVLAELREAGVEAREGALSPASIRVEGRVRVERWPAWERGEIEVQDEGSQLLVALAGARPGHHVIDVCAGAGGKSLAFAHRVGPTGRVTALESDAARLERLTPRRHRARTPWIEARVVPEATLFDPSTERLRAQGDVVFVDAPCTGWGTLRRRPELGLRQSGHAPEPLVALQRRLLAEAAELVAHGGVLVWATCSLLADENEGVADAFDADPRFERIEADGSALPAAAEQLESLRAPGARPAYVLRPDLHDTDGFFLARWRRVDAAP